MNIIKVNSQYTILITEVDHSILINFHKRVSTTLLIMNNSWENIYFSLFLQLDHALLSRLLAIGYIDSFFDSAEMRDFYIWSSSSKLDGKSLPDTGISLLP